jgi:hypothetical protein
MATNRLHLNPGGTAAHLAAVLLLATVGCCALANPATAAPRRRVSAAAGSSSSYGWPLRPFHSQHPVRGFFGDPRIGRAKNGSVIRSFHFGIDIAGADGTAVYATLTGRVRARDRHHDVVAITGPHGRVLAYWHVVPAVRGGQHVVAYKTMIGHIAPTWGHVHFAEYLSGTPLNPLRPGALGPYVDTTSPLITGLGVPWHGLAVSPEGSLTGPRDLVVEVHDVPQLKVAGPWSGLTAAPELVRWRIDSGRWSTALDFRLVLPRDDAYDEIYAYHTHQNRPQRPGHYLIYLARRWDAAALPAGSHSLEVLAADIRGNQSLASISFTVTR